MGEFSKLLAQCVRAGFVDKFCLNLVLPWNALFFPPLVIESFVKYISLGWHVWSFRIDSISPQALLAFRASIEETE